MRLCIARIRKADHDLGQDSYRKPLGISYKMSVRTLFFNSEIRRVSHPLGSFWTVIIVGVLSLPVLAIISLIQSSLLKKRVNRHSE